MVSHSMVVKYRIHILNFTAVLSRIDEMQHCKDLTSDTGTVKTSLVTHALQRPP